MGRSKVAEEKRHAHAVGCLLAVLLSACASDEIAGSGEALRGGRGDHHGGGHHRPDAGPAADAGVGGACTRTPDEWLATCDGDEPRTCGRGHSRHDPRTLGRGHACDRGPSERECEDLASSDERTRELAALRVNVRVLGDRARRWCRGRDSEDDFEDLHFSHGYRRTLSVADLLDDPSVDLSAIADANRAFEGCVDRGVLVPWVQTPVCTGSPVGRRPRRPEELRSVEGPAYAPCVMLDGPCARGVVDPRSGCCTVELALAGTVCGESAGLMCDGAGACVDAASVPEDERVRPSFDWLAIYPDGIPLSESGTGQLTPRVVATVLAVASPPTGMPEGSVEIHTPFAPTEDTVSGEPTQDPGPEPTGPPEILEPERPDVLAVLAPWVVGVERVTIARSPRDAPIRSISYAGPVAPHSLLLAPRADREIGFVWVVRGELDRLGAVLSDGSTAGAELVACSPPAGELELAAAAAPTAPRCDLVEGLAVVTGVDVAVAWLPNDTITPIDLLGQGPPPEVVPPGTPGIAGGAFGDFVPRGGGVPGSCGTFSCTLPGGCSGVRFCSGGLLGPCVPNVVAPDGCDGLDNNCNGLVDEGGSASCNDGLDCTFDACDSTADPTGPAGCRNIPAPRALCIGAVRPGPPSCVTAVCNRPGLPPASTRAVSAFDTPTTPAAWGASAAPTGCSYFAGNNWCTNSYDSCTCDGPELCNPSVRMNAGCVGSPRGAPGPGGAPIIYDPCDGDGLACTDDRVCCEPSAGGYCRDDELLRVQPGGADLLALRAHACGFGGPGSYPLVPTYPPALGSVTCAPGGTFTVPFPFDRVCPNDGNPCTVEGCNELLGGVCGPVTPDGGNPNFRDGGGPAETFVSGAAVQVGPSCDGSAAGSLGCNLLSCNDTATCGTQPIARGRGTPACFGPTEGSCLVAGCDGAGACNPYLQVDPAFSCPSLPGCPGAGTCSAIPTPDSTAPGIPLGCRPPMGFCYYGPGQCVPSGTPTPDGCGVCAPLTNAWAPSPGPGPGTCPDDGNECTADVCVGGACGNPWVPNGTGCTDDGNPCTIDICVAGACGHACDRSNPACETNPACRPN